MAIKGTLKTSSGVNVNGSLAIEFRIYNASSGGTLLWGESQNVSVFSGSFVAILGSAIPLNLSFEEDYHLGIKVGSDSEMSPRMRLTSSPYTFKANVSDRAKGVVGGLDMTAYLNLSGKNITNVTAINPAGGSVSFGGDALVKNIIPSVTNLFNLGASSLYFSNAFVTVLNMAGQINSRSIVPADNNTYTLGNQTNYFSGAYVGVLNLLTKLTDSQIEDDITANLTRSVGQVSDSQIAGLSASKIAGSLNDSQVDNDIQIDTTKDLRVGGGYGSGGLTIFTSGDIWANGSIFLTGNITSADVSKIEVNGSFAPAIDNEFDFGNSTLRWRDVFVGRNILVNGSVFGINVIGDTAIQDDITANLSKSVGQVSDSQIAGVADTKIAGSGTLISNLNSDLLDNKNGSYYLDASNLNAGTLLPAGCRG
ncbi:MAG: hypothetical protein HYX24_04015 [Candidatus Aenigmarchaeota archaeon]|nr:hypothetical protein [Candidatus Aenigmarchaeota archaeon]